MPTMNPPENTEDVALRAAALLQNHQENLHRRTDRLFAGLMAVQWLASLIAAYWIAPQAWEGMSSQTHPHVWIALFLGGVITLYPILLAWLAPGRVMTRHVIAIGQLLMSGLLIHLTGGRSETHFHIFGSLAFLAFYRDWRVLVTASLVTALDHGVRGYFWPESIYGVASVDPWQSVEHIGWVIFTDIFLMVSIAQSMREMKDTAWRQARHESTETSLQQTREQLEIRVEERTAALALANAALERDISERKRTEKALRENEERLRLAMECGRLGSFVVDAATGKTMAISDTCRSHFGVPLDRETSTAQFFQTIYPSDLARVQEAYRQSYDRNHDYEIEFRFVFPDSSIHWVSVHGRPVSSEGGEMPRMIGISQDITERKAAEEKLQKERDFISAIVDTAGSLVVVLDRQGEVVRFNRACEQMTGYSFEEVRGKNILDIVLIPEEAEAVSAVFEQICAGSYPNSFENHWVTKDGSLRRIAWSNTALVDMQGEVEFVVATGIDITERMQLEKERELELAEALERANRDPLTNLLNHRVFQMLLEQEIAQAKTTGTNLAMVVLDIDNFKFFNDCYGHTIGDEVLRMAAAALQSVCRPKDILARFGSDEFALILPDIGPAHAPDLEAKLRTELKDLTFKVEGMETAIPITLSIGAAVFPQTSRNRLELLRQADERLMMAKTGGEAEAEAKQVRASALQRVQGFSMLDALVTAVDNKDRYTRRHSEDVMIYSVQIAQELGLSKKMQHTVAVAALLHDVGKIGVPDAILRKPGRLTEEEFEAVKQHPQMGAIMVATVPGLEGMLDAIRHHHEQWDGGGYPFGLMGEETPLIARLMAVADAFSAMTTDRPYRKGMDKQKALLILDAGASTQWDPVCVNAFLHAQNRLKQRQSPLEPCVDDDVSELEESQSR